MTESTISLVHPESEEALLSLCLYSQTALYTTFDMSVKSIDFHYPTHRLLYETMKDMFDRGELVDKDTVLAKLEATDRLEDVGGRAAYDKVVTSKAGAYDSDPSPLVQILKDRSIRRSFRDATEQISSLVYSEADPKRLAHAAERLVFTASERVNGSGGATGIRSGDLLSLYGRGSIPLPERIPFPFKALDRLGAGRRRGALTIWGAYSSDGKSTVGQQSMAEACRSGFSVAYFSLEMPEEDLLYRLIAAETGLSPDVVERGGDNIEDGNTIDLAVESMKKWDFTMYADPDITPSQIRGYQMRNKYDLIEIDYLQRFNYNEWSEIPRIAKSFKNLALSTKCCVDVLSQLRAPSEFTPGKNPFPRPNSNSLYGGRATAHEADNVVFVWANRDPAHNWERDGTGEIINSKARGGKAEFSFPVVFDDKRILWKEL